MIKYKMVLFFCYIFVTVLVSFLVCCDVCFDFCLHFWFYKEYKITANLQLSCLMP